MTGKTLRLAFIPVMLCLLLLILMPSFAEKRIGDQVAGHRVEKILNNANFQNKGINYIFEDYAGRFWIASAFSVDLYDERQGQWVEPAKGSSNPILHSIKAIAQSSDGKIWFLSNPLLAASEPNLNYFDGSQWLKPNQLSNNPVAGHTVTALFSTRDRRLWFAIKDRLVSYDGSQWKALPKISELIDEDVPVTIRAGFQDSTGYIWLGTSHGIVRFQEQNNDHKLIDPLVHGSTTDLKNVYALEIAKRGMTIIYEDRRGRLWFGSVDGHIMVLEKGKDTWAFYDIRKHLQSKETLNQIYDIYQDKSGQVMFATSGGLLTFSEGENTWKLSTSENSPLPSSSITTIFEDKLNRIWVGTGKGIIVLDQ